MTEHGDLLYPEEARRADELRDEVIRGNKAAGEFLSEGDYRIQRGDLGWEAWHVPVDGLLAGIVQRTGLTRFVTELFVWGNEPNELGQAQAVTHEIMGALGPMQESSDG